MKSSKVAKTYQMYTKPASLVGKSLCVGVLVGLLISLYRLALQHAEELTFSIYTFLRSHWQMAILWFVFLVVLALFIGWLSKRYPMIGGSGIPQVKGIMQGYFQDTWLATLIAKFSGGFLSIVAGLSLGREGPSIQLGACAADGFGRLTNSTNTERRILIASGASSGLAAAFGAPLAGVVFAVEEIFGYIAPSSLVATMVATVSAQWVAGNFFGLSPIFHFNAPMIFPIHDYGILIILGAIVGLAGAFYNWFLINTQKLYLSLPFTKSIARTIPAFILAGVLGLVFPIVLGGGHVILDLIAHETALSVLVIVLVVKFLFSMVSFQSGAPGGIFFPLLIMGALIGAIVSKFATAYLGMESALFGNIIIYAMAGFFTGIVRAPLTGIILLLEMTGSLAQLLPFTVVSVVSYIMATVVKITPIYDSLLDNMLEARGIDFTDDTDIDEKTMFTIIVKPSSLASNRQIKDLPFPQGSLVVSILRNGKELTPHGNTTVLPEDRLYILCAISDESRLREKITEITEVQ